MWDPLPLLQWLMAPGAPDCALSLDRPEWQQMAACRGTAPDVFVQEGRGASYNAARTICGCCDRQGLDFAVWQRDLVGMWGGATEAERREIRLQLGGGLAPPELSLESRDLRFEILNLLREISDQCSYRCSGVSSVS